MKLIVVRHGQTDLNVKGRLQGQRHDEPLNFEGLHEVERVLAQLNEYGITTLYTSSLRRAKQTAELISKRFGLPINTRHELAERDFGTISGLTWDEVERKGHTTLRAMDKALKYDYRPFDGESNAQVRSRIKKLLFDLLAIHNRDTIACVTHGGIIRILYDELNIEQPEHTTTASLHIFNLTSKDI